MASPKRNTHMEPDEYLALLKAIGLKHKTAATMLAVGLKTSYRYGDGSTAIPRSTAILLRLMQRLHLGPADLAPRAPPYDPAASSRRQRD